jgi:hypothetical protein
VPTLKFQVKAGWLTDKLVSISSVNFFVNRKLLV